MSVRFVILGMICCVPPVYANPPAPADADADTVEVRARRETPEVDESRAVHRTTRKQLAARQPRSTPEALHYAPGVYVQQTAHGQGSPYIRGRTGQQTLLLFDGLRLNHALFRKGPNQYLFTVDPRTLAALDVIRGSASVELGNDALAGAVILRPLEPALDPTVDALRLRPQVAIRHATADGEMGGRLQLDAQFGDSFGVLLGVGARTVGRLEAGGDAWADGRAPTQVCVDVESVPCFEANGRSQIGTGFDEFTADARAVAKIPDGHLTLAAYLYRQYDAPRTDQCPPPEAPSDVCLVFDEQFRTHIYAKLEQTPGLGALERHESSVGYQRQHQRYTRTRPDRFPDNPDLDTQSQNLGRDAVDALSGFWKGNSQRVDLGSDTALEVRYGIDGSYEWVESQKWTRFSQPAITRAATRGQYVEGSAFGQAGAFIAPVLEWGPIRFRTGGRVAYVHASSPGEADSASAAFERTHWPVVFNLGVQTTHTASVFANIEQGFRAPNLDDLTGRQSTGRGYQFENPDLRPEKALTIEGGLRVRTRPFEFELLAFHQSLDDAVERRLVDPQEGCSFGDFVDRACRGNRAPQQLVNLTGTAVIYGAEAQAKVRPLRSLQLSGTVSYTYGEGDNPARVLGQFDAPRVPLSRIPPLNGTAEAKWTHRATGAYLGAGLRWADRQDALSTGDVADARIPPGGTPGFLTFDALAGIRVPAQFNLALTLTNITDARYRTHGSGVLGAGRSVVASLELAL